MSELLKNSMFYQVVFPATELQESGEAINLSLRQLRTYKVPPQVELEQLDYVVFDLETTGLDSTTDQIIEIGAIRFNWKNSSITEFSTLVNPFVSLSERVQELTGLKDDDLKDKPEIKHVLPDFLKFIDGAVLIAHNADYDYKFLQSVSDRMNIDFEWPCFCTLKMSRKIHPELLSRSLDALATHYELEFSSRHRSMGDCEVTNKVLKKMWNDSRFTAKLWQDLADFYPSAS